MRAVKNWALATFILCFLVIIAGGIVRTTQSGMGCPDWPTCFGKWIPPTNASELPADFEKYLRKQDIDHTFNAFHTWIEYINRLLGVLLGLFGIIQVALFIRHRKTKPTSFKLAIGFLVAVILTGLFGAIVVRYNLAHLSISVHLFFAILLVQIQLAVLLALQNKMFTLPISKKLRITVVVFLAILFFHSVLGTMVRMYVDDVSKFLQYKQRDTWLAAMPVAFLIHRSFSWVVLIGAAYIFWVGKNTVIQTRLTYLLGTILLSVMAGITLVYADMPAAVQPLHLLLAAVAITQTINLLLVTSTVKPATTT
jgi:heme a synthase